MSRVSYLTLCVLVAVQANAVAAELTVGEDHFLNAVGRRCPIVKLWPDGEIPDEPKVLGDETVETTRGGREGLLLIRNVAVPSMTILSPTAAKNTGAAIVLCPGGGYGSLACNPVIETAKWMNARGITVVLLKYRVPKRHHEFAMNHQPL
ncbi:MAG: hypothetical protein H8E66_18180 [Planctomycetes bacterium]|nr:hypothetical protein [Planctomycetota bacterium]